MNWKTVVFIVLVPSILGIGGVAYDLTHAPGHGATTTDNHVPAAPPMPKKPPVAPTNSTPETPSANLTNGTPGTPPPTPAGPNASQPSPTNLQELINASNRFAMEMFSNLSNDRDNLFFSPYSIFTALGMTYEGARNQTADEMRSVFHFPADNQTRWSLFFSLINKLDAKDAGSLLATASALWVQNDFRLLDEFLNVTTAYYKAEVANVDTAGDPEGSRVTINTWVENHTCGKIKDLIPQGIIDRNTRLVLTNAIYFKGDWLKQFNVSLTEERNFHPDAKTTVKAQMMALLPKAGATDSLESMLTPQKLNEWRGNLTQTRVDVYFPKFKLETKYYLKENLSKMGMPTAFSNTADFSGMNGYPRLYIAEVIHQGFVAVDEQGTEAAAATAVVMKDTSCIEPPVPVFNVDHPFIFIIQERDTGNILFMGKLVDPTR